MYVRRVAIGGRGPASSLCDMYLTAKYLKRTVCAQNYHLLVLPSSSRLSTRLIDAYSFLSRSHPVISESLHRHYLGAAKRSNDVFSAKHPTLFSTCPHTSTVARTCLNICRLSTFRNAAAHPRQAQTASEWAGTRKPRRYRGVPVVTCRCFLRSPLREIWICVIVIIQQVVVPRDTSSFLCHRECAGFELLTAPSQLGELLLLQRKARSKGARPAMDYAASALHNTLPWQVL